jgi:hypothetical protein
LGAQREILIRFRKLIIENYKSLQNGFSPGGNWGIYMSYRWNKWVWKDGKTGRLFGYNTRWKRFPVNQKVFQKAVLNLRCSQNEH